MDDIFEVIVYIAAVVIAIVAGIKKKANEQTAPRPRRHIMHDGQDFQVEFDEEDAEFSEENRHFSYETMSDRDFAKEFSDNIEKEEKFEAEITNNAEDNLLSFDEDEVYKGIIYSEILKRKY